MIQPWHDRMAEMDEKRRFRRRRVLREGRLLLEAGLSPIKCIIRDESEGGAKLRVSVPTELPKNFSLVLVAEGTTYPAELVWRRGDDVGVAFVGEPRRATTAIAEQLAGARKMIEQMRLERERPEAVKSAPEALASPIGPSGQNR